MVDEALFVARAFFWILSLGVVFLPMRWALFCFILASHMDITSLTFASASHVGFENTVRVIGLPAVLLWRTRVSLMGNRSWTLPHKAWAGLTIYAAIAGLWGGFPLSAFKMVAYLSAYFVLYRIFCYAWTEGWLDVSLMRQVVWSVIPLAILQTYVLGNGWGGPEDRFTSFSTPQYFSACMVALLAILVFSGERGMFHYLTCGAVLGTIVVSGSRYVIVSTVALLVVASFRVVSGNQEDLRWKPNVKRILLTLALAGAIVGVLSSYLPYNRMDEIVSAMSEEDVSIQDVGTVAWRLGIYAEIFSRLEKRNGPQLFFGSGTSSGASLMVDYEPQLHDKESIDGNRALHSEYLRALYEWGIFGLGLLCLFLIATIVGFARKMASEGGGPALAFLGVLPSIVIGLAIENVLAGAASAAGVGILLAMSFAWQMEPGLSCEPLPAEVGLNPDGSLLSV
jgi:hypothetical protein